MKLLSLIAVFLQLATPYRCAVAEVTHCTYDEQADKMVCKVETADGSAWQLDDYRAFIGAEILVLFDDNGTQATTDDEIKHVIAID